jgi:hypothetical protein
MSALGGSGRAVPVISLTDRKTTLRYQTRVVRHWLASSQMLFTCKGRKIMNEVVTVHELIDAELDAVCGGVSDLGKYITKAVDDAISAGPAGPPDVWVGCAWVPQR